MRRPGCGPARRVGFRGVGGRGGAPAPWTPADLTGLRGWYRADDVVLVGSDVQTWTDRSGVGNHLGAPSAGARPLLIASDAAFGGGPVVELDGVAEWLRCAAFSWGGAPESYTIHMVVREMSRTDLDSLVSYDSAAHDVLMRQFGAPVPPARYQFNAGGGSVQIDNSGVDSAPHLITLGRSEPALRAYAYVDGALHSTSAALGVSSAPADGGEFAIGSYTAIGGRFGHYRIAEIVVQRGWHPSEITQLAAYVATRYSL